MDISEAKNFRESRVNVTWADRLGNPQTKNTLVLSVEFIPLYGPCLITLEGDISLDRVIACEYADQAAAA